MVFVDERECKNEEDTVYSTEKDGTRKEGKDEGHSF